MNKIERICIVGLGYIGLPTAVTIASTGIEVLGCDTNENIVDQVNEGKAHFFEPDLNEAIDNVFKKGLLKAFKTPQIADAFVIAVPTPHHDDHSPDISIVEKVAHDICAVLKAGDIIVLESTSPVGTTQRVAEIIAKNRPDLSVPTHSENPNIYIAYCPERIIPGQMMRELIYNDRSVGGLTKECSKRARRIYETYVKGQIHETDAKTAELVKLAENAYRDVNIAFANELSIVCRKLGINVFETIKLANHHPRVAILNPGIGVGGHCIAIDPWFIISPNPEETPLMRAARGVNDMKPHIIVEDIIKIARANNLTKIACFGLAYKPNVDDFRESPAIKIVELLTKQEGLEILIVEPSANDQTEALPQSAKLISYEDALEKCELLALLVPHKIFADLRHRSPKEKIIFDPTGFLTN